MYAAAASSALALSSSATAAIIYSGPQNITATRDMGGTGQPIHIDGQSFGIWAEYLAPNSYTHVTAGGVGMRAPASRHILGTHNYVRRLLSGAVVSDGQPSTSNVFDSLRWVRLYSGRFSYVHGDWPDPPNTGFAGLRFTQGGLKHFGWLRLKFIEDAKGIPDAITAIDWAYNDVAGAPIRAGQTSSVPEPDGKALALLAAGSLGLLALRKYRARDKNESC
jgi:hypothetical protein